MGGAEFVGDVLEEAAFGGEEGLEAVGHLVEGTGEVAHFVAAIGMGARAEIAVAEGDHRFAEAEQGTDEPHGEKPGKENNDDEDSGEVGKGIDGIAGAGNLDGDEQGNGAV